MGCVILSIVHIPSSNSVSLCNYSSTLGTPKEEKNKVLIKGQEKQGAYHSTRKTRCLSLDKKNKVWCTLQQKEIMLHS